MRGSPVQKTAKFGPVKVGTYISQFLAKNRLNIRASERKLHLNVKIPNESYILIEN